MVDGVYVAMALKATGASVATIDKVAGAKVGESLGSERCSTVFDGVREDHVMSLGMMTAEQMKALQTRHMAGTVTAQEVIERFATFAKNDRSCVVYSAHLPSDVVDELKRWGFDVLIDEDGTTVDWSAGKGLNLVPPRKSKKSGASAGKANASRSAGQTTAG